MDIASQIKGGLKLPQAVSFEERYGLGPLSEDDEPDTAANDDPQKKGDWLNKAGDVIEVLPELFCTIFPQRCQSRPPSNQPPIIVQPPNQRDWLTISLIVVVLVVLLILILKK
ncbi:MAG TPA: hypothetical protein VJ953_18510 [Saprospiraceae bacterium]|nr:hypothetical protein [Saprospiraceae bacterium]